MRETGYSPGLLGCEPFPDSDDRWKGRTLDDFLCLRVPNLRSSWALPAASREHVSRSPRSVPKELSEPLMQRQLFLEWLADFHKNQYVPKPQLFSLTQNEENGPDVSTWQPKRVSPGKAHLSPFSHFLRFAKLKGAFFVGVRILVDKDGNPNPMMEHTL